MIVVIMSKNNNKKGLFLLHRSQNSGKFFIELPF